MALNLQSLDRRRFLRGTGVALALPWLECSAALADTPGSAQRKRLAVFYQPDGVPMPLPEDPAHTDWAWFPHGSGNEFTFTKCLEPLEPYREDLTVLSGFSHPAVRSIHGHSNADQFLTAAPTGATGPYQNSISLDQAYAAHVGDQTRFASLVLSTDGGTGTPRGAQNGIGVSDYLARAVGFNLTHQLSHETKEPGGWKNFGTYCRFLSEEYGRFIGRLKNTPEPAGEGSMLDNTLLLFGSASSAFHLSRNYPLILTGGRRMGFRHGQYVNRAGANPQGGAWAGGQEPWQKEVSHEDIPLSNLFVTMLQRLGVQTNHFADSTGTVDAV